MKRSTLVLIAALLCALPAAAQTDKAGCADHPLFPTRMPGYSIQACTVEEYGVFDFSMAPREKLPVEGKYTFLTYRIADRSQEPSALAVVRNYESAIQKVGGTILTSDPKRRVNGKIVQDGREIWVQVEKGNGTIWLRVVEKAAMTQYIVADAAALGSGLAAAGHVALDGIYFDTDKSEVKPESEPALQEIAKLMAQEPGLTVKVVGHTDMTGALDANLALSRARAEAVVQALVARHGVAASRLQGYGVGPLAPVATNGTQEGRAKNRRVELVKN
jgi:outer membrane protein OmpA-like peptidoglycan-associated protein